MEFPILKESGVVFDEAAHKYWLGDKELQGITSTLVHRVYPHDYDGVSQEKLNERAAYGHKVHDILEFCITNGLDTDQPEWYMFKQMVEERGLQIVRCEYIVTDYERYASPIDVVLMRADGGIVLGDIKTNYAPPVEKATVQLSWYRKRFEEMNPDLRVVECAVFWVRSEAKRGNLSGYYPIVPWCDELLEELIQCDIEDKDFAPVMQSWGEFPTKFAEVEEEVVKIEMELKRAKERQEQLRKGLYDMMTQYDRKSFTSSRVKLTRVLPTISKSFDSKRFEKEHPDLYAEYLKESKREGSLKITIRD